MIRANPIVHHNSFHDGLQRKYEGNGQEIDINLPGIQIICYIYIWHSFCWNWNISISKVHLLLQWIFCSTDTFNIEVPRISDFGRQRTVTLARNERGLICRLFQTISKINMINFVLFHPKAPKFYWKSVNFLLADCFCYPTRDAMQLREIF